MTARGATRGTARVLLATALLLGAGFFMSPTFAHTELVSSTPGNNQAVSTPPGQITLTFNEEVSAEFSTVLLSMDGGDPRRLETSNRSPEVLLVEVDPDRVAADDGGSWRVDYRVTSADGHPIEGVVEFQVEASPSQARSPSSQERKPLGHAREKAGSEAGSRDAGWALLSGPAAVLGLIIMLAVVLGLARIASKGLPGTQAPTEADEPRSVDEANEHDSGGSASSEVAPGEPVETPHETPDGSPSDALP